MTNLHSPLSLHIDGADVPASKGRTFKVVNPLTGEAIFDCAAAELEDYENAIHHAQTAFESWSKTTPSERRLVFLRAADIITGYLHGDAPEILSNEVSAVPSWIRQNILATAGILRESAGLVTQIKG